MRRLCRLALCAGALMLMGAAAPGGEAEPAKATEGRYVIGVEFVRVGDMDRALLESFIERERRMAP